jgi:uncharacterized membrane protein YeaQ/YmgE (transglycosylase-associated protein family)
MNWILWVLVGFLAGWFIGRSLEGEGHGRSMDMAMGIGGAVVGGFLVRTAGFFGAGGAIPTTVAAIIGAMTFTTVAALSTGRKVYTRTL